MRKKSKSQASFEYIVIYGWATLIILASVGILYSFDLMNFNSFIGDKCSFYGQVECVESQATADNNGLGDITVILLNNFGTDLVVYNYSISDEFITCTSSTEVHQSWLENNRYTFTFPNCGADAGDDFVQNSRTESEISVYYYRNISLCNDGSNNINTDCLLKVEGLLEKTVDKPFS